MSFTVNETRKLFLDYFKNNGHKIITSSPLVPHNDPSLMFTNSGMVQFKNIFTGQEKVDYARASTSQKCVRAGGKHNDLDNVGYTARHHTFFEMLGNFSFGDYFKEEAIYFAWNFITKELGLAKEKLYVTIYHNDEEAFSFWQKHIKSDRIIRIETNDNFWSMGDTGPCGPCSEIFYDHGEEVWGGLPGTKDADGDRYIEIWNLVFMQFEQLITGERIELPKPSIDTGMGLERLSAVLQGKHNNYEIDSFIKIIEYSQELTKNNNIEHIASHRVIADHLRSSSFLIADGVMPSNEGRGYVLRRIMRRAMRHINQLGAKEPLMYKLTPVLLNEMGEAYPELIRAKSLIQEVLKNEEETFNNTLSRGLKLLNDESQKLSKGSTLKGDIAFKLYDTYGFPYDLTKDILRSREIDVDELGFKTCMQEQKLRAKAAWSGSGEVEVSKIWFELHEKFGATEFIGYNYEKNDAIILAIISDYQLVDKAKEGEEIFVILNQTPFYGESGGQQGDKGEFVNSNLKAQVLDTKKYLNELHVHKVKIESGTLKVGDNITALIDTKRRKSLRANHSATHLLHEILRRLLGDHVVQKGSLVAEDRLRFDFSHHKALSQVEIDQIEYEVNKLIRQNSKVNTNLMSPEKAIENGAMALFGEKYGDEVRCVTMGLDENKDKAYSFELCGGTHVNRTGDISIFKIISESAIAAGIRRIEAMTGEGALNYLNQRDKQLQNIAYQLKVADNQIEGRISSILEERKILENKLSQLNKQLAMQNISAVKAEMIGDFKFINKILKNVPAKELREIVQDLVTNNDNVIIFMASIEDGKVSLIAAVSNDLVDKFNAVEIIKIATNYLGGKGGGGKANFAQSGATDNGNTESAIKVVKEYLIRLFETNS